MDRYMDESNDVISSLINQGVQRLKVGYVFVESGSLDKMKY